MKKIGLFKNARVYIYPVDKNGHMWTSFYVYDKQSDMYLNKSELTISDVHNIKKTDYFGANPRNYKYYHPSSKKEDFKMEIQGYKIKVDFCPLENNYNNRTEFSVKDIKEFEFYKTDCDFKPEKPIYYEIKKGDKYFYKTKGICEVTKVIGQQEGVYCEVETKEKEIIQIKWNDEYLFYIPYKQPDELEILYEEKDAYKFQPFLIKDGNVVNLIWQPIENAARYIVKMYKYLDRECYKKLYYLKDYEVSRNEHLLSIDNLIGRNYLFVIIAEDRDGKELAKTTGIRI